MSGGCAKVKLPWHKFWSSQGCKCEEVVAVKETTSPLAILHDPPAPKHPSQLPLFPTITSPPLHLLFTPPSPHASPVTTHLSHNTPYTCSFSPHQTPHHRVPFTLTRIKHSTLSTQTGYISLFHVCRTIHHAVSITIVQFFTRSPLKLLHCNLI